MQVGLKPRSSLEIATDVIILLSIVQGKNYAGSREIE